MTAAAQHQTRSDPHIVTIEPRLAAIVRKTVRFAEMPDAQRTARATLGAALNAEGIPTSEPWLTVWRPPQDGAIDYAPGIFVPREFNGDGVTFFTLPAGRAAHFRLIGSWEGMAGAWQTLFDACKAHGWATAGVNWEVYSGTGPVPETDLYALLT